MTNISLSWLYKILVRLRIHKKILSNQNLQNEFKKSLDITNIKRARIFLFFVLLFSISQFITNFINDDFWNKDQLKFFCITDIASIIVTSILIAIAFWGAKSKSRAIHIKNNIVVHLHIILCLLYGIIISSAEQYMFHFTPTITISALLISIIYYIEGWVLGIYLSVSLLLLLSNAFQQIISPHNPEAFYGAACIVIPIAWMISRILMPAKKESYIDKYYIALARNDLEKQVRDRTKELQKANQELKQKIEIQKQYEKGLKKAKQKAEESDSLKSAFLANMSHEIRTPMNAIMGFSELLTQCDVPDKKQLYREIIKGRCSDLVKLIDHIVIISQIESGQIKLYEEKFSLNMLLHEIVEIKKKKLATAKKHNIKIIVQTCFSDEDSIVTLDKEKVKEILKNIIDNSIKFTDEGNIIIGYTLKDPITLLFSITDTGIGIPENKKQIIFDKFTQSEIGLNRRYDGIGLGLSICKEYIKLLGGEIWLDSMLNHGTKVSFTLPYTPVKKTSEQFVQTNVEDKMVNLYKNKNILLVEDDFSSRELFNEIFSNTGINITFAQTGQEALSKFHNEHCYDLVLMDIQLPDISGLEVTKSFRKNDKSIPIIAQSAFISQEIINDCYEAGCNDYISKPIDTFSLHNKIKKYLKT